MTGVAGVGVTAAVTMELAYAGSDTIKPLVVSATTGECCETRRDDKMNTPKFAGQKTP